MYPITEYYRKAVDNGNPSYLTGTITFEDGSSQEINASNIASGGASITMEAVTQDVLEFGAAVLGQLDIYIKTNKNESRYKYYNAIIDLYYSIETEHGTVEIPLGIWIVTEADREKTALKLCAYDNLFKLDKAYTLSLVGTPYDIMSTLVPDCECELAEDEDYYTSLPNGNLTLTVNAGSGCNTYRQAVSIVAQMCGCFVQADRYGKISMKQFSTTPTFKLAMNQRYKSTIADYVCKYVDLVVAGLGGSFRAVAEDVESGMTLHMEDAPAWDSGTEETLQTKADNLMAYLKDIQYTPCDTVIISDPSIDCGDLIKLETENGTVNTLVTSYTWKFHGQMELQSVGKNPYLISNSAGKQRVLRDLENNGGSGGVTTLYTFKNTRRFKCTNNLTQLAQVIFVSTKDTFVLFNATFQIDVDVSDITTTNTITIMDSNGTSRTYDIPYQRNGYIDVTIQYYYNSAPLGLPYTMTLEKGSHVITLHYPINSVVKDSINRFEIRMSANGESAVVAKEAFLGTISGQGLVTKPKWDGTITFEEEMGTRYRMSDIVSTNDMTVDASITKPQRNVISGFSEQFSIVSMSNMSALDFADEFGVNRIVTNYTFETAKESSYEYDHYYVKVADNKFTFVKDFEYVSEEQDIDSGRMCSVVIRTDDKSNVEGVTILHG